MTEEIAAELAPEITKTQSALEFLRGFRVTSAESNAWAADRAREIQAKIKIVEDRRTSITKPILEGKRRVDAHFKPLLVQLEEAQKLLKSAMGAYSAEQDRARALAMQASATEYAAGGTPTAVIPEPAAARGVTIKHKWIARIVDPELVPKEFWSPDLAKIQSAISYFDMPHTPPPPIPGVAFDAEQSVTVRK